MSWLWKFNGLGIYIYDIRLERSFLGCSKANKYYLVSTYSPQQMMIQICVCMNIIWNMHFLLVFTSSKA